MTTARERNRLVLPAVDVQAGVVAGAPPNGCTRATANVVLKRGYGPTLGADGRTTGAVELRSGVHR